MLSLIPPFAILTAGLVLAAFASSGIIRGLSPWLSRRALALPNARSSHSVPTPQGGGLGVMGATLGIASAVLLTLSLGEPRLLLLGLSLAGLTGLGLIDDMKPLGWRFKLMVQIVCAVIALAALPFPGSLGALGSMVVWVLGTCFLVGTINLVNFVDGIDEITAAHALPSLAVPFLLAAFHKMPLDIGIIAATTMGAVLGFWFWNRHPARVFLGDCGSLPLGLLLGWLSLALSLMFHPFSGITVLLYPLADGCFTMVRRLMAGERLTQPHRQHAYQQAVDAGLPSRRAAGRVGMITLLTAALCLFGIWSGQTALMAGALVAGLAVVSVQIFTWYGLRPSRG